MPSYIIAHITNLYHISCTCQVKITPWLICHTCYHPPIHSSTPLDSPTHFAAAATQKCQSNPRVILKGNRIMSDCLRAWGSLTDRARGRESTHTRTHS